MVFFCPNAFHSGFPKEGHKTEFLFAKMDKLPLPILALIFKNIASPFSLRIVCSRWKRAIETAFKFPPDYFQYICRSGNLALAKKMMADYSSSEVNLNWGLWEACGSGQEKIVVEIMKTNANLNLDEALFDACFGGHIHIVKILITSNLDWNLGLEGACFGRKNDNEDVSYALAVLMCIHCTPW